MAARAKHRQRVTFKATAQQVRVPASAANLGPGFDSLALALELRDIYVAQILDEPTFDIDVTGEGQDEVARDKKNLVIKAMYHGFDFLGGKPEGIALRQLNEISHGRGLGSSAAAIVGGLALSRALVLNGNQMMSDDDLIALATDLEGHPDNVAAATLGGLTISWMEDRAAVPTGVAVRHPHHPEIKALLLVPDSSLATSKARKLLPELVSHSDASFNLSRSALLVHALQSRPDLLLVATADRLHQSYRREAMTKSLSLVEKLRAAGVAAVISGAGPSVLVLDLGDKGERDEIIRAAGPHFTPKEVDIATTGVESSTI
jgi:homoserine kinase